MKIVHFMSFEATGNYMETIIKEEFKIPHSIYLLESQYNRLPNFIACKKRLKNLFHISENILLKRIRENYIEDKGELRRLNNTFKVQENQNAIENVLPDKIIVNHLANMANEINMFNEIIELSSDEENIISITSDSCYHL